jgi:F-type H+-transporting ATPase subunit delta
VASSTRAAKLAAEQALGSLSGLTLETAAELFAVANALQESAQLRSLLTDPSAAVAGKEKVVRSVFGGKISDASLNLTITLAKLRWSATRDIAKVAEQLAVRVVAGVSADAHALQAELFSLEQLIAQDNELELALSSNRASGEQKQALIKSLISGKLSAAAELLALQAVLSHSVKRYAAVLENYGSWLAQVAGESVALITVAKPLSDDQLQRLGNALTASFGRKLQLNVEVSEDVIGGVHVAVNGEVIDATLLTKLNHARLQLN